MCLQPRTDVELATYSLAAAFITLMLIWNCFGSVFAGLLGYSRIPYGAARCGHFFAALGKAVGVMLLRRTRPDLPRPYRMVLYPLPCFLASAGWLFLYVSADGLYIALGLGTMTAGVVVYFVWRRIGERRA